MTLRSSWRWMAAISVLVFAAACGPGTAQDGAVSDGAEDAPAAAGTASSGAPVTVRADLDFLGDREVYLPQFAGAPGGPLYVVWREPAAESGGNLLIARRGDDGTFSPPSRINDIDGSAGGGSLDEGRPAVAVGDDGLVAVAWTARGSDIRAAVSLDGGQVFAPSVALNSDAGARAYRGFVDIAVDDAGIVHAAWIDGRFAPRGAEEPAELFYARIDGQDVLEINLTEDQESSICGCCRVDVDVRADDRLVIAFRNTGDGYRDIFRIEAGSDRAFGDAARLGPPMWELNGCPVIGPLNVGAATLWSEASTGKRRILAADETEGDFTVVLEDTDEWFIERPPRRIVGSSAADPLLLVPGRPAGKVLRGSGTSWEVVAGGIPRWAMSAALIDGSLIVIGGLDGALQVESREADF